MGSFRINGKQRLNGVYKNGSSTTHEVAKDALIIGTQWTDNHQKISSMAQSVDAKAIPYTRPTVKIEQLKRVNALGNDDLLGTNVFVKATIGFNPLNNKNGIILVQIGIGSYVTITTQSSWPMVTQLRMLI
ncbi:hypothetical protein MGH68_11905 [Erysipelothrix sp. D19-032]